MKKTEAAELATGIGKLFPGQLTKELAAYATRELLAFTPEAAAKAVREHRGTHDFISWPQLWEGCRAAEASASTESRRAVVEERWPEVQRRLNPQLARAGDVEVILRVHRSWWARSSQTAGYRSGVTTSCRSKLVDLGMGLDDADRTAGRIFDPPAEFQGLLYYLRTQEQPRKPTGPERQAERERIVDFVRRVTPRETLAKLNDADALEFHFGEAWRLAKAARAGEPEVDIGRNAARAYVALHAAKAFEEVGRDAGECQRRARQVVELQPGEKIVKRALFRSPSEPQTPSDALKELARAEHGLDDLRTTEPAAAPATRA